MKERNCSRCGTRTAEYCPDCVKWFGSRPDAKTMSVDERIVELRSWTVVEIPFTMIRQRIDELVGRSVFTNEIADIEALADEIRSGKQPSLDEIIGKLPSEMTSIIAL